MTLPVCFLSDYGSDDEFVGVVHRVIAEVGSDVPVIDVNHQIPPHDVRAGALALWRSIPWLAPGVILAVVDPGVGTARRPVAVTVGGAETVLVGPDNGLLIPAAHRLGSITQAVVLDPPEVRRGGRTFDGRDLFAPAAALIAGGVPPGRLGQEVDPSSLVPREVPVPERQASGDMRCEVLWVDRFGNAQLNASMSDSEAVGAMRYAPAGSPTPVRIVAAYADLGPGEVGLVVDSYGMLSISMNCEPAAAKLNLQESQSIWLVPKGQAVPS